MALSLDLQSAVVAAKHPAVALLFEQVGVEVRSQIDEMLLLLGLRLNDRRLLDDTVILAVRGHESRSHRERECHRDPSAACSRTREPPRGRSWRLRHFVHQSSS